MRVDMQRLHNLAEAVRARSSEKQQPRAGARSWYRIENKANETATIYVYDFIGEWGVSAQDFVNDLRGVKAQALDVHINSEGGEVFDGLAIYEAIRQHKAGVTVYVDGLAASAASFIAMAGDTVIMAARARMMIHDAHGLCIGNSRDMRELAGLLDDLSDNIADIYAERAGGSRQQWRDAMRGNEASSDGTWYDAQAAVDAGLADEIAEATERTSRKGDGTAEDSITPDVDNAVVTGRGPEMTVTWDAAAFLAQLREVENPEPPVRIPDGRALLENLRVQ